MSVKRIVVAIATVAANAAISYEWYRLPPNELADMVFNIISRESLIVGGIVFSTGLTILAVCPALQWLYDIPARRRAKRQAEEEAERGAEADRQRAESAREAAKRARVTNLFEELRTMIARQNGDEARRGVPYDKRAGPYLPLRRLIYWLGTYGYEGVDTDDEAMTRALALFAELDALGLVPGGIPQGNPPENDGLDLNWYTELGRIMHHLQAEGVEATRAKLRDWYGHLDPAPLGGSAPAVFNYGDSLAEAVAGRGRAEHRRSPENPEPPV